MADVPFRILNAQRDIEERVARVLDRGRAGSDLANEWGEPLPRGAVLDDDCPRCHGRRVVGWHHACGHGNAPPAEQVENPRK